MAKIQKEVYKEVQKQFNEVVAFSQGLNINDIQSDRTFSEWAKNKGCFYEAFGNQLIYNCGSVSLSLSNAAKEDAKKRFLRWLGRSYYDTVYEKRVFKFFDDLSVEEFFNNTINGIINITTPEEEVKALGVGMKPLRAIRFILPNEDSVRRIQDKASEYIQQIKIEGELCLSIHPLDFLSLSENDANWRSCHSLDGDYRAGNLSYLMDSSTIIAYIKSPTDRTIPRFPFPWNNKKWRNLLFFDDGFTMIFAGRPYPFESFAALKKIEEVLKILPLFKYTMDTGWQYSQVAGLQIKRYDPKSDSFYIETVDGNDFYTDCAQHRFIYDTSDHYCVKIEDLIKDDSQFCHYNDLLHSSCYFPYYSKSYYSYLGGKNRFSIGHEAYCLLDENEIIDYNDSDRLICRACRDVIEEDWRTCDCCGNRVAETMYVAGHDIMVCSECYNTHVITCDKCGIEILDYLGNSITGDKEHLYCVECYNQLREEQLQKEEEENANGSSECE